jgi:UDP-N-acetylglucosamine 2-epimerase (non-hydrolysing)
MKIMTILGTRPEIIRLSLVISLLDQSSKHILVHTGQNYDDRLSKIFFAELGIRLPDVYLGVRASGFGGQIGQILELSEALFLDHRPERLLVLGDTNSGLTSIIARRMGIPVYHMEAGNRCYDDRVPEEVNRRIIDHSSSVLMPYTNRSRANLLAEGFPLHRVYVTGNPIKQVMDNFADRISNSCVMARLELKPKEFFLVTFHRAENVDSPDRLRQLIDMLSLLNAEFGYPVLCSMHPRTRSKVDALSINLDREGVSFLEPLGFFDFQRLEQSAFCLLSDSGTVQEESCILNVPSVILRDVTERPETLECGSTMLAGTEPTSILRAVRTVTAKHIAWRPPEEYLAPSVAETVCQIVTGFRLPDNAEMEWRRHCEF